jgi:hypothetical protein
LDERFLGSLRSGRNFLFSCQECTLIIGRSINHRFGFRHFVVVVVAAAAAVVVLKLFLNYICPTGHDGL